MASAPSAIWQMLEQRIASKPLPRGLDAAYNAGMGLAGRFVPRRQRFLRRAEKVLALEKNLSQVSDSKLRDLARDLRAAFRCRRDCPGELELAFALVREAAHRQIGERPFLVQVAGAFALEAGCVAEMATGEGKTLTATMPATVAGWRGRGCHIITVNDYLARRDAEWMGQIYRFCGVTVAYIEQGMAAAERRKAYSADLTYCTNKEVTADFLRDRLVLGRLRGLSSALLASIAGRGSQVTDRFVQRGLNHAIVDEADSVLIDEAVTPLIISGSAPNPEQVEAFSQAADIVSQFNPQVDYRTDLRYREIELTNEGKARLAELGQPLGSFWSGARRREELATQALTARELFQKDKHYVIDQGKVVIVDEFTGRLMPDRTWRDGLHQAIEAKEKLQVNPPKDTYARISFQRFFRLYRRLCGMTGTAKEATAEFWQIYNLPVVTIPTNRPCQRLILPDMVLATESGKWERIVQQIVRIHQSARPILVGTRSIKASVHLSQLLTAQGLDHQVLNAIHHRQEAQIVAGAGKAGKITVATNMAGRGTDIKLGARVAESGGLAVITTERHESGRIDRQLFGRAARQGDPGSAQAIVSLEDELASRYTPYLASALKRRYNHTAADISSRFTAGVFQLAQHNAERLALRLKLCQLCSLDGIILLDEWLPGLDQVAFLDEHLGNPPWLDKRECHIFTGLGNCDYAGTCSGIIRRPSPAVAPWADQNQINNNS